MLSYMPSASMPLPNVHPDSIGTRNTHKMTLNLRNPTSGSSRSPKAKRIYLKATVTFILLGLLIIFLSIIQVFERILPGALVGLGLVLTGIGVGVWRCWAERRSRNHNSQITEDGREEQTETSAS